MTSRRKPSFAPGKRPSRRPGRAGSKRDLNRAQRAHELAEAALGLFLEDGVEPVTIEDVTRAAGVAKGSFYRYYDDKIQLVEALVSPLALSIRESMNRASHALASATTSRELTDAYRSLAFDLARDLLPNARVVRLYLQESRGPATGARAPLRRLADEVARQAHALTLAAHHHRLLRDLPPHVTATAVVGAVEALLFRYLEGDEMGTPEAASEALIAMVLEGLRGASSGAAGSG